MEAVASRVCGRKRLCVVNNGKKETRGGTKR